MLPHTLSISQSLETATWLPSAPQEMKDCTAGVNDSVHYSLITKQIYLLLLASGRMSLCLTDFTLLTPSTKHLPSPDCYFCCPGLVFDHVSHLVERTVWT